MKKIIFLVVCLSLVLLYSCATVKVGAPRGQNIKLMPPTNAQPVVVQKKVWYVLWGLVPLSSNSTADMVKDENLKEMSCQTYFGFTDFLLCDVLGLSILSFYTRTVVIRGQ